MYFGERGEALVMCGGMLGMVLSGGLVKNPAATMLRHILFLRDCLVTLRHFHNRRLLFADLPGIVEFSLAVCRKKAWVPGHRASVGLDLDRYAQVDSAADASQLSEEELHERGGVLLILTSGTDLVPSDPTRGSLDSALAGLGCDLSRDLDRSQDESFETLASILPGELDARRPSVTAALCAEGCLPLWGSRSIAAFSDTPIEIRAGWDPRVQIIVRLNRTPRLLTVGRRSLYYRLCIRATCGSPKTNARSLVATVVPAGAACTHKIAVEAAPWCRPNWGALTAVSLLNGFCSDALVRPKVQTTISKSLLADTPAPDLLGSAMRLLARGGLRLVANHTGYALLWHEQLGEEWREPGKEPFTWPVLATEEERWDVRSAIDAVVAQAYGLSREQYEHVLRSFDRASRPQPSHQHLPRQVRRTPLHRPGRLHPQVRSLLGHPYRRDPPATSDQPAHADR